jgi:hypothetical protein
LHLLWRQALEEGEDALNVLREKRAAIFDDTKDAQHDAESLEKLQKAEEQLETLLAAHLKSIGYGPAGQGSN